MSMATTTGDKSDKVKLRECERERLAATELAAALVRKVHRLQADIARLTKEIEALRQQLAHEQQRDATGHGTQIQV